MDDITRHSLMIAVRKVEVASHFIVPIVWLSEYFITIAKGIIFLKKFWFSLQLFSSSK